MRTQRQKQSRKHFNKYHFSLIIIQTNTSENGIQAEVQESKEQLVDTLDNELLPEEEQPKELNGETKDEEEDQNGEADNDVDADVEIDGDEPSQASKTQLTQKGRTGS